MSNTNSNYHGISKIKISKIHMTEDNPYEYLYITFSSAGSNHSIVAFGEEDILDIEMEDTTW